MMVAVTRVVNVGGSRDSNHTQPLGPSSANVCTSQHVIPSTLLGEREDHLNMYTFQSRLSSAKHGVAKTIKSFIERETDRQTERETETDRQTDRNRDRETETD